jgi:AP2 domain-containing protein/HNH endonuclease
MPTIQYPPIDYVRQILREENGHLFWKDEWRPRKHFENEPAWKKWNARFPGKEAGTLRVKTRKNGIKVYRWVVEINGIQYYRAVLIFGLYNNKYPEGNETVDHIDRNTLNDKNDNLRIATKTQSSGNTSVRSNNKCGYKGVTYCKYTNRWRAIIRINGKATHLGRFDSPQEAHQAYVEAAKEHFGEFHCPG